MKYQKCHKKDLLFEAKLFLFFGSVLFIAGTLPQQFLVPKWDIRLYVLCVCGMIFFIISLVFLFIARHKEREYKLIRTIDKMLGTNIRIGRLQTGGPIHLPYTPGTGFPRKY